MKHKDFLLEFEKSLPDFLQEDAAKICTTLVNSITEAIKTDGIEIRGCFSIKAKKAKERNSIIFKDLTR